VPALSLFRSVKPYVPKRINQNLTHDALCAIQQHGDIISYEFLTALWWFAGLALALCPKLVVVANGKRPS
jgi:hypothetical protein